MKKLIAAAALSLASMAYAGSDKVHQDKKGTDATDVSKQLKQGAAEWADQAGIATQSQGTFNLKDAYEVKGTLKDPKGGRVTIARTGMPDASLDMRKDTVVMLDGKKVTKDALPEGCEVRAMFQLEGKETVALKLEATHAKTDKAAGVKTKAKTTTEPGTGGAGTFGETDEAWEPDAKKEKLEIESDTELEHREPLRK